MTFRPFGTGARDRNIDELILRSLRNELTDDESARLAEWRHESSVNEQLYRRSARLSDAMAPRAVAARQPPAVESILSGERSSPIAPRWTSGRRTVLRASLAAGIVLVVSAAAFEWRHRPATPQVDRPLAEGVGYSTGPSEMATVQLSDGSVVRLAPSSKLRFVQHAAMREATLEGRAFFSVAKIAGRAFRVHTRLGEATVLGTKFEMATDSSELKLLVVSGRVALAGSRNQVEVHGGEVSGVRQGTVAEPTRLPDAAKMNEWVGKFLAFQSTPMREVAREIQETYGIRIVIEDSVIANRTVIGTFTDRDSRDVIDMVCSVVNAQCVNRPGEVVMSGR